MSGLRRGALVLAVSALGLAGCHRAVIVPLLGIGPLRPEDPTPYDDVVTALRASGHPPVRTDPEHGRFAVRATSDPSRATIFVVQCSRDGYVTVAPQGARIEHEGDTYVVSAEMRAEWADIVMAIERSVPETR